MERRARGNCPRCPPLIRTWSRLHHCSPSMTVALENGNGHLFAYHMTRAEQMFHNSFDSWQFYWFQPQGPQDMASAHIKQSKTLANLSYSRQLYTPQHTRDEAIGDVDNSLFVYEQTRSPLYEHTHPAERRSIKTDKTERSTRHWRRRNHRVTDTFCNCIEYRTIGLQTHS